jgi:hypothetical protein
MRPSPLKHTLAVLRYTIGPEMTQKELGRLVNRAPVTIQKIELNKLPLTDELAREISIKTGVSFGWLRRNNTSAPIISRALKPYTRVIFERTQARDFNDWDTDQGMTFFLRNLGPSILIADIMRAYLSALQAGDLELLSWRLEKATAPLMAGFKGFENLRDRWAERMKAAVRTVKGRDNSMAATDARVADATREAVSEYLAESVKLLGVLLNRVPHPKPSLKSSRARRH